MKDTFKVSILIFIIILVSNTITELMTDSELSLVKDPIKSLGFALILSLIGGLFLNWIYKFLKDKLKV